MDLLQWLKSLSAEGWGAVAGFAALGLSLYKTLGDWVRRRGERKRAHMVVWLETVGRHESKQSAAFWPGNPARLCIHNRGAHEARNVEIHYHPGPAPQHIGSGGDDPVFPLMGIGSGGTARVRCTVPHNAPITWEVELRWVDGSGKRQAKNFVPSVPEIAGTR